MNRFIATVVLTLSTSLFAANTLGQTATDEYPSPVPAACHQPGGDLSPDGQLFVSLIPDTAAILLTDWEQGTDHMELSAEPVEATFLNETEVLVSFGSGGELAIIDTENSSVVKTITINGYSAGLCRLDQGRVLITDPDNGVIHLFDSLSSSILKTFSIGGKPWEMRWVVKDVQLQIVDKEGNAFATLELNEQPPSQEAGQ